VEGLGGVFRGGDTFVLVGVATLSVGMVDGGNERKRRMGCICDFAWRSGIRVDKRYDVYGGGVYMCYKG
jgi:hypothetical protein